jgi:hypothetical protein
MLTSNIAKQTSNISQLMGAFEDLAEIELLVRAA